MPVFLSNTVWGDWKVRRRNPRGEIRSMKILILESWAEAFLTFRKIVMREMMKKGHDIVACAPDASTETRAALRSMGVAYRRAPMERTGLNPIKDVQSILKLRAVFRTIQPDMVLGYTVKPVIYGSIAGRLAGVPRNYSMITGLGYSFSRGNIKTMCVNAIVMALYRLSMRFNHRVFLQFVRFQPF